MLNENQLGVHPPGALGVAFFMYTKADCFVGVGGDGITNLLMDAGSFRLQEGARQRAVPLRNRIFANLLEADALGRMPELLLICCNPNQLEMFTADLTRFLESLVERGRLTSKEDIRKCVPILLILPNGVLAEQCLQTYADQLHESKLMDRLPGVTDAMIQALLNRVVRGVSLQAGGRRGSGPDTVYLLEPRGSLVFAGGGAKERERIETMLTTREYPHTHVHDVPRTRIEFDKAMISIVLNVGGIIYTVKPSGELIDLRMGDLCKDPSKDEFIGRVTRAVFDVGMAIGAYTPEDTYEKVWEKHRAMILRFAGHVTSSVKGFNDALGRGLNTVKLFSNEEWILTPLARYADKVGLRDEGDLFEALKRQVQDSMARAIKYRDKRSTNGTLGTRHMKLAAQRNVSIELFEAGDDDLILVGTMLDNEHLIKLEITLHLPDEQITRSRLDMIRAPFPVCHEVEEVAQSLVGLRIERGVLSEIAQRVGGRVGCSHIKELATNIVYFVASHLVRRRAGMDPLDPEGFHTPPTERFRRTKTLLRDSCLAYCQTTPEGLDEAIGIRRLGDSHACPVPLGECEPSLGHLLRERISRWKEKTYLRYRTGDEEHQMTWIEFGRRAFQIARHLLELDVRAGDRIAMISENRAEMFLCEMAAMSIGAVSVPIFAGYHPPQLGYVLRHARPRYVIVSGNHQLKKIEKDKHPWIERYYVMDFDGDSAAWGAHDLAELTSDGGASMEELDGRIDLVKPEDLGLIMYTSGTTGPPKGVCLAHGNLISQQKAISQIWDISERDVFMAYLPWHHSFGGLFERFMSLYNGTEFCIDDSRGQNIDRLVENWKAFKPTLFFSVPRIHDMLLTKCREDESANKAVFGGNLRFVFTAGASLPAHVEQEYRDQNIPVLEGWGLTETSPCVTVTSRDENWKSGFVGFPIPGVTVRIGTDQEILAKGPNIMLGYLDDEEATAHVIDEGGWFHTGDLGEFTPDGLRIFGRKDGAFKLTTGEKVHPQRIEMMLVNESPFINSALVVGSGQDYVAVLIYPDFSRLRQWADEHGIHDEHPTHYQEVRDLLADEIERINPMIEVGYQRVKRAILAERPPSLEKGELTPSAKIIRQRVCAVYRHEIEEMFGTTPPDCVIEVKQPKLQKV